MLTKNLRGIVMRNTYYENLIKTVIDLSESNNWENAVSEWEIIDCEEDETRDNSCVCGKERLRYLFTLKNIYNDELLFPIGSSCIHKFERDDFDDITDNYEDMFKLLHAVANNDYITLDSKYFSRKLLRQLYEDGAFNASRYNSFDDRRDYQFLLDMFNKRDKNSITQAQYRKINAIIARSIRPYLIQRLKDKTNSRNI